MVTFSERWLERAIESLDVPLLAIEANQRDGSYNTLGPSVYS